MPGKGEIVQIHIGQAGVQIANACWELYCLEHGIYADGRLLQFPADPSFSTFFSISNAYKAVPRVILADTEPTVIDEIRTGAYKRLFHPQTLVTGKEDTGSNYARGYHSAGENILGGVLNAINHVVMDCENLQGFLIFRAIGGGTGSGFGTLLMEKLYDYYGGKVTKVEFNLFPSPSLSSIIVEPYNAILSAHHSMDFADVSFIVDNEALYDICASHLDVRSPTYTNLNRLIGQVVSAFTASQRFTGESSVSFSEFQTNLVPYPRIHYPLIAYSPIVPITRMQFVNYTTEQITSHCFLPGYQMVRCNPTQGKYMAAVLLYRGDISGSSVTQTLANIKRWKHVDFVDWVPTGFKTGINHVPPTFVPGGDLAPTDRAVLCITNNSAIQSAWCRLVYKFDKMYSRRAFVYHYVGEGMEEGSFNEASENLCQMVADYQEVDGTKRDSNDYTPKASTLEDEDD